MDQEILRGRLQLPGGDRPCLYTVRPQELALERLQLPGIDERSRHLPEPHVLDARGRARTGSLGHLVIDPAGAVDLARLSPELQPVAAEVLDVDRLPDRHRQPAPLTG